MIQRFFIAVCIGTLTLTACIPGLFAPTPLISSTGFNLTNVDKPMGIAVEPNGRKSVFWLEREGSTQRLHYWRTRFGEAIESASLQDNSAASPDIAVTDNGMAYLVWFSIVSSQRVVCYSAIPVGIASIVCIPLYTGDFYSTMLVLRVVARGDTVYVVYPGYGILYYRQLSPTISTQKKVADYLSANSSLENMEVTIDKAHKLHVTWVEKNNVSGQYTIRYNSNATTTPSGDMNQEWILGYETPGYALALTTARDPEKVYIIRRSGGRIFNHSCLANGCTSKAEEEIHLTDSLAPWSIWEIEAIGIGESVYVAFLAANNSTTNSELYFISNLSANPAESRVTNTDHSKTYLNMVRVQQGSSYWPVVGWRRYSFSSPYPIDDAYVWAPGTNIRKIFTSDSTSRYQGADMAANGEWIGAVWASEYNGRVVPYLSGNAYNTNLPLVTK